MSQPSAAYTVGFAAAICVVCSIFVAGSAVGLKDRQEANKILDRKKKVLSVAGLIDDASPPPAEEVGRIFEDRIRPRAVDMAKGAYTDVVDASTFDQRKATKEPETSHEVAANKAKVKRVPTHAVIYEVLSEGGAVDAVILPVQGAGLWSTLYGYLAIDDDAATINGLTFYEHAETPGLGGEVDNPKWKALWKGKKAFKPDGSVGVRVVKGVATPGSEYDVDGLSGATLTSKGVSYTMDFWLGDEGFGPFLSNMKNGRTNG